MGKAVQRSLANPILDLLKMTQSLSSKTQYSLSLSLSLSLNFYVNIWPVVVSIDMGFLYFVFFDIIILCVCGTIHFVIHQYRKFSIFVEAFGDVSLSSKTNYSLFKFFIWFFHFMFFDISLCVSSSIHFLFFDNCCKCERVI